MSNVVNFPSSSTNRQCPECGGEWWLTGGVVVNLEDSVVAYAQPLRCMVCEAGGDLKVLPGGESL